MSAERGETVGNTIGFHVRFQRRAGPKSRILVVTEGILLRMLLDDPWLTRVSVVVFDEFHERNLNSDLALAMIRRLQLEFRPELQLVVMSATLDPQPIAAYLDAPVVISKGQQFPVEIRYLRQAAGRPSPSDVARLVANTLPKTVGDMLVFLPGVGEIRRTHDELLKMNLSHAEIHELYGDLPLDLQEMALRPADSRKIILSTNVAETSVTIEGVTVVLDTGLARILSYDVSVGLNRLMVERISRASAGHLPSTVDRAGAPVSARPGRAGSPAPGSGGPPAHPAALGRDTVGDISVV
jgi:ATP-dependent helicase HrpB